MAIAVIAAIIIATVVYPFFPRDDDTHIVLERNRSRPATSSPSGSAPNQSEAVESGVRIAASDAESAMGLAVVKVNIRDLGGSPLSGVTINLDPLDKKSVHGITTSAGSACIQVSRGTIYRLHARLPGYFQLIPLSIAVDVNGASEYSVTLAKQDSLAGVVRTNVGDPLEGVDLSLMTSVDGEPRGLASALSGVGGRFRLNVEVDELPRRCHIVAHHRDYELLVVDVNSIGVVRPVTIILDEGATVRGRVLHDGTMKGAISYDVMLCSLVSRSLPEWSGDMVPPSASVRYGLKSVHVNTTLSGFWPRPRKDTHHQLSCSRIIRDA